MWKNHLINVQCKACCLPLLIVLIPVEYPQSGNPRDCHLQPAVCTVKEFISLLDLTRVSSHMNVHNFKHILVLLSSSDVKILMRENY